MHKYKFIKKTISLLTLSILIFPLFLVPQTASASDTYKNFLKTHKCVASYLGDPMCKTPPNLAGSDDRSVTINNLYKAIYSQGAVITLLDEPLSNKGLITVLKFCNYKKTNSTQTSIVVNACSEYYVPECPTSGPTGQPHIKDTPVTDMESGNLNLADYAYFTCSTKQVIIASSGTGLIQKYLRMVYNLGTAAAGIFAILVIMFNGIKISISGSDESAVDEAKKQIINSLLALTVLFLSGFILYIINPNFFTS